MEENNEKKGKGGKIGLIIAGVVVALLLGLIIYGAVGGDDKKEGTPTVTSSVSSGVVAGLEKSVESILDAQD